MPTFPIAQPAPSEPPVTPALLARNVDYTDKDFDALRLRLQNLIGSVFPEWTDFNVANFGNILLELFAFVGDVLTFYQDGQSRESRLITATQRKNVIALAKMLGYTARGATAATVDVLISLPSSPAGSVTFPRGTVVSTLEVTDPVEFQLLEDAIIAAGADPAQVTVTAENSESHEELFQSSGLPNQQITLSQTPFIDSSAAIVAGNGTYAQVSNFLDSAATDRHFTVVVDQNDRAQIRFGNGINGQIPSGTITIDYKTGGGTSGRVEAGTVRSIVGSFTDEFGASVTPTITNPLKASGGADRETIAQIKANAPASIRAPVNSVALEDFVIHAQEVPGVSRALFLTSDQDPGVAENSGIAFVIPVGGGTPTQVVLDDVLTALTVTHPPTVTFGVTVEAAPYKTVDVLATVYLRQGTTRATAGAAIRAALTSYFAPQNSDGTANTNIDFGANLVDSDGNSDPRLALSDIFNVVRDVAGVRRIGASDGDFLLNLAHTDVLLSTREFPQLGTVSLVDGDNGTPF